LASMVFRDELIGYLQREQNRVYRLAYGYTHDEQDALDVVQASMVKALTARPMREPQYLSTWVYRIVVNTAIDWLRQRKRLIQVDDDALDHLSGDQQPPDGLDVHQALAHLPTEYKTIVMLRFFEELKLQEIADVLDLNINTVKTRLYHALVLLRAEMEYSENG
jgi:RNA polymerase sigma-70 factor, ECF subfamily